MPAGEFPAYEALRAVAGSRVASVVLCDNPSPMTMEGTNSVVLRAPGAAQSVVVDPGPEDAGEILLDGEPVRRDGARVLRAFRRAVQYVPQDAAATLHPRRSVLVRDCTACGACCSAPDIHALQKPLGVPCLHLDAGCLCRIYDTRPQVCRNYQPDWVCGEVAPLPTLEALARWCLANHFFLNDACRSRHTT